MDQVCESNDKLSPEMEFPAFRCMDSTRAHYQELRIPIVGVPQREQIFE
jgi:hypothetical protein